MSAMTHEAMGQPPDSQLAISPFIHNVLTEVVESGFVKENVRMNSWMVRGGRLLNSLGMKTTRLSPKKKLSSSGMSRAVRSCDLILIARRQLLTPCVRAREQA